MYNKTIAPNNNPVMKAIVLEYGYKLNRTAIASIIIGAENIINGLNPKLALNDFVIVIINNNNAPK
jgi:hypothetical protein